MKKALLVVFATLLSGTACFTTRLTFKGAAAPTAAANPQVDGQWHHGGILGLVEFSSPLALDTICPHGVAYADQETSFLNGLVRGLTSSLYTPQTVTVYCVGGAARKIMVDELGRGLASLP